MKNKQSYSKYEFEKKFCSQEWETYEKENLIMLTKKNDSDSLWSWIEDKIKEERKQAQIEVLEEALDYFEESGETTLDQENIESRINNLKNEN